MINKQKIINDPVHGFITISNELLFDIIEHPLFQRLRRIKQLGLSCMVYPGAMHTRFSHTLGVMHLVEKAIDTLRMKYIDITDEEALATKVAVLFHDIGHAPYSHSLENILIENVSHEQLSLMYMEKVNQQFHGKLDMAIKIFKNEHNKHFLHQLICSQLDMDRLDYLARDSFFTGVSEGIIGTERIISMLNVFNEQVVIEEKGVYSIEKFIISRRLMYWQVYLHKAVLTFELLLIKMISRVKELRRRNVEVFCSPHLDFFLRKRRYLDDINEDKTTLHHFANIDDSDIMSAAKVWTNHSDFILATLASCLVNRRLFKIELRNKPFEPQKIQEMEQKASEKLGINLSDIHYFVSTSEVKNNAYSFSDEKINILFKSGVCLDISEASDQLDKHFLNKEVKKYFLCYPKDMESTLL